MHCFRPEVHVQEWSALIQRFSQPGDWILDSTAGSASIVAACLRLNRRVFTIEKETDTELFARSKARALRAYGFFSDKHMLRQGRYDKPSRLKTWERHQMSWVDVLLQELKVQCVCARGWVLRTYVTVFVLVVL